jgi:hypothetical protein
MARGPTDGDATVYATAYGLFIAAAVEVAEAFAGRSQIAAVLGDLPANSRTALSHMANFFTPAGQSPT